MNNQTLIACGGVLFGIMLITALLLRRDGVRRGNRLLAASVACTLCYLIALVIIREEWEGGRFLTPLLAASYLLSPALLLGYVRSLFNPQKGLRTRDLLHTLPALAFLSLIVLGSSFEGGGISNEAMERARGGWPPNLVSVAGIFMYLVQLAYFSRALFELQTHRQRVPAHFSYEEQVTLRWLRVLMGISLLLSLAGLGIALIRLLPGVELWPRSIYSMTAVLLVYYLIGIMGMSQPAIFTAGDRPRSSPDNVPEPEADCPDADAEDKYGSSALSTDAIAVCWAQVQALMASGRPFLDNRLRIADLAGQLDIPVHHLSQTINHSTGQSFFEYINGYRVEAAKELLRAADKPVSQVAFDAGFNSESAFYRHFKKVTHITPKQFQRQTRAEPAL